MFVVKIGFRSRLIRILASNYMALILARPIFRCKDSYAYRQRSRREHAQLQIARMRARDVCTTDLMLVAIFLGRSILSWL
jgi:hypothetical protein